MNPEMKEKWLEKLRSGKYSQTTGQLWRRGNTPETTKPLGYCCMGILGDILVEEGLAEWEPPFSPTDGTLIIGGEQRMTGKLTQTGIDLAGVSLSEQQKLVYMNDGGHGEEQSSFNTIADYIEENL